jgi:hypothetical protein
MTFLEYSQKHYRRDLERFVSAYRGDSRWTIPAKLDGVEFPESVMVCDCNLHQIEQAMRSGLEDRRRFAINVALEAILFAGVHKYDRSNFERYVKKLKLSIYVEHHGVGGVRNPHILLAGGGAWSERSAAQIRKACVELLPRWASAFDGLFGEGRGSRVLRALAGDADLRQSPYDAVPEPAMNALRAGLREAARDA